MADPITIPQMFLAQSRRYGDRAALRVRRGGLYQGISWNELEHQARRIALGLMDLGISPGDRAAILSENRPEWAGADLGILCAGGASVPVYTSLTSEEIGHILTDSGARVLFVSTPALLTKVVSLQERLGLKAILFDAPYRVAGPRIWWLGELMGLGRTAGPDKVETLERRIAAGKPEDLASIIYTSGTTGPPKGVMLTHGNFMSNCRAIRESLPIGEQDETLSFLPLSHVFERTAGYYFVMSVGATISYAQDMDSVPANLLEVRPTILTAVPRFYEKMHERIQEAVRHASPLRRWIFHWAVRVGKERAGREQAGALIPACLRLRNRLADRLVFSKLRARLGGRLRYCISGGAPLPKELAEFYLAAGVVILEGYGLTETSPVISANRPDRLRLGTVGLPLPGVEVRIAPDGEILTRGPHVMKGYFNNPQATAEAIDPEGWFHTGDIGELDADGFLKITDRKKDLIKTSGGKMVAPQNLEALLKSEPTIADCVVIGDKRKYISALIVPKAELLRHPHLQTSVEESVRRVNARLASFEQIKRFSILPEPFTIGSGELTPTLKIKRRVIAQRYADQIESMYRD